MAAGACLAVLAIAESVAAPVTLAAVTAVCVALVLFEALQPAQDDTRPAIHPI